MSSAGFRIEGSDNEVRVPDVVMRCVGFVGEVVHEDSSGVSGDLRATGFFIASPFLSPELAQRRMAYFVTAAHVAKDLCDKPIYFLVNKRGGGVTSIRNVWGYEWWIHPTDRSADVVVIPFGLQPDADVKGVAVRDFVTSEDIDAKRVGIGDEVLITGLFTEAPGVSRNMPIARTGNIAMLPDEPLQTEMGFADVYLVEARSIGGLSGSPVFVRSLDETAPSPSRDSVRGMKLLGLMHGHWDIKESEMNKPKIVHDRQRGVNLGIGIVVPAAKIAEIINSPQAIEVRMAFESKILQDKKSIPGTDSARPRSKVEIQKTATGFEIPVPSSDQFESVLKKASRKSKPKSTK